MRPTLRDGDIVAIDLADNDARRLSNKVVALRIDGGTTVKRLRFSKVLGLYLGQPDNPDNDDQVQFPPERAGEVLLGKVAWAWWRQR